MKKSVKRQLIMEVETGEGHYICSECMILVDPHDNYCSRCGKKLIKK